MKKALCRGFITCLSIVALSACQDYDAGFNAETIKKAEYDKHFVKTFGEVDPEQDWSMAAQVSANVNLPQISGASKMNIMTGDPRNADTRLLAQIMLNDGQGSINFDAIKGSEKVFVTVEKDNAYQVFGEYTLSDGMLNVGDVSVATRALVPGYSQSQAFSAACPTTQSTTGNYYVDAEWAKYQVVTGTALKYGTDQKSYDEWVTATAAFVNGQNSTANFPFTDESVRHFVQITGIDWEKTTLTLKKGVTVNETDYIYYNWGYKTVDEWKVEADNAANNIKNGWGNPSPWEATAFAFNEDGSINWNKCDLSKLLSDAKYVPAGDLISYVLNGNPVKKSVDDWKTDANNSLSNIFVWKNYQGPWEMEGFVPSVTDCSATTSGAVFKEIYPESQWVLKSEATYVSTYGEEHVKVQYLTGVEKSSSKVWDVKLGNSFFGADAFFAEGVAYYTDGAKLNKYYTSDEMVNMENGYKIHTTSSTTIELPYIFGCTAYSNQFGYVYWSDEEAKQSGFNPLALKHFILIEDARPGSNITYTDRQTSTATAVTGSEFSKDRWATLLDLQRKYVGTTYRPMYFGTDRNNSTGSYEFPANVNIVFFISTLTRNEDAATYNNLLFTDHNPHGVETSFNYSDPSLNKMLIGHETKKRTGEKTGMVKCISWTHDGNTYMGFGDNCGDEDLNDIVFLVSGNFDNNKIVKVAAIKWHLNYDQKHHDGTNNTTKDDDLHDIYSLNVGATYGKPASDPTRDGYTFKGWATTPTATASQCLTTAQLTEVKVTNENTVCYYAIWEAESTPSEEMVTIKWHKNYNSTHDTTDSDLVTSNRIVKSTGTYSKPSSNPEPPTDKVFKGWATTPTATEVLTDDQLTNQTSDTDKCYYAIYEDKPDVVPDPEYISWIFACEDLGGTFDYDFNDVVWEVQQTSVDGSTTKVQVRVLAAGGTLPFTLSYDGTAICTKQQAFPDQSNSTVINAGTGTMSMDVKAFSITVDSSWTLSANYNKFSVLVENSGESTIVQAYNKDQTSKTPQVIILPGTWQWPTERTPISTAYPNFTNWVKDNTYVKWPTPASGTTVSR